MAVKVYREKFGLRMKRGPGHFIGKSTTGFIPSYEKKIERATWAMKLGIRVVVKLDLRCCRK
jgi:hypothetical protein